MNSQHRITSLVLALLICLTAVTYARAATIVVPAGGNLQSAINTAQLGDTIVVEAGAIYRDDFVLPKKSGTGFLTIQSSRAAELPIGVRIFPGQSALLAKLQSATVAVPVIRTAPGAHHYRFIGVDVSTGNANSVVFDLVRIGDDPQALVDVPHNIIFDRCWIHGFATQEVQRGIALNGAELTVSNSYISDIHGVGYDTQALCGWNGPGPFRIINNYVEAAGENILFGGNDPSIPNLVPSNIEIRHNLVSKPLSWQVGHPTYAGKHWTIKNALELKNARTVVIDGNVFENCWPDAQIGIPILFTARNQDGTAPWSVVEFVTFTNNIVRNAQGGVHILRTDAESLGAITSNITISNNLFESIKDNGFLVLINNPNNITAVHNTVFKNRNIVTIDARAEDPKGTGLTLNDNLFSEGDYGVHGDGVGEGTVGLTTYYADFMFAGNNLAGRSPSIYPAGNTFFTTEQVGFMDLANGNLRLAAGSPLKNRGTDGKDVGANIDLLLAAQNPAPPTPAPTPTPTPTPTPLPTPTPTPSPTPMPSPTPTLPRVVGRTLSATLAKRIQEVNQIEKSEGLRLIGCSDNVCYFVRP